MMLTAAAPAQSLAERLDEDRFLRGLIELQLPEVLDAYIAGAPIENAATRMMYQVAAERMRMNEAGLPPAERLRRIERVLALRQELLTNHEDDPRRAIWRADQASDLYFALLPHDAAGLTTAYGLPSPAQRARAQRVAREMVSHAAEAELDINEAILELEFQPGFRDDVALQLKRRRLAREERDRRIPFLYGVGAYLHASFNVNDPDEQQRLYQIAVNLLDPVSDELEGSLRLQAMLYAGLSHARLGEFETAESRFRDVATNPAADPADIFAARMGGVRNRLVTRGPQAALEGLDSIEARYTDPSTLFYRLLIIDQRFLLMRSQAMASEGSARDRRLAQAFDVYTNLLEQDLGVPRETIRAVVMTRLANAAETGMVPDDGSPLMRIAQAESLARDEASRPEAIAIFEATLADPGTDARLRAAVLFDLGRALVGENEPFEAARRFDQLAREHGSDPRAEEAIELAAMLLADLHERAPSNTAVGDQYERTLALLLERFMNLRTADRWRIEAAMLAAGRGRHADAERLLGMVTRTSDFWPQSRLAVVRLRTEQMASSNDPATRSTLARAVIEAVDVASDVIADRQQRTRDATEQQRWIAAQMQLSFHRVDALLVIGQTTEAIAVLDAIEAEQGHERSVMTGVLRGRLRAHQAAGDPAAAATVVRRFIDTAPEEIGAIAPALIDSLSAGVETLLDRQERDAAIVRARADLLPVVQALHGWLADATLDPAARTALQLRLARGYRLAGAWEEAEALYDIVLAREPNSLEANFGRAECLHFTGRDAEAMVEYRRISAVRAAAQDVYFWTAELRMLEILERVGRNTHQIRPRIDRLQTIDPELGGERTRRGLEALRLRLAR